MSTKDKAASTAEELSAAKRKLVAELLTPDEIDQVAGGDGPHWQEFTRFVMSTPNN